MQIILTIIGIWGGTGLALLLYALACVMRRPQVIKFVSVIGWLLALFILANAVFLIAYGLRWREGLGPLWAMVGVSLLVLMGVCAGVGKIQERQYHIPWAQTFAVTILEAGIVVGTGALFFTNIDTLADILRQLVPGLGPAEAYILMEGMLWKLFLSWAGTLLCLEFITPFLLPARDRS